MITIEETRVETPKSVATTKNPGHLVVNVMKPRRKARLLIISGLVLLFCGGLAWWWASRGPQPMTYTVAIVSRAPVSKVVNSTGTVNPVLTIMVGTYVSGVIQDLSCDYNTQVRKGQLCAKIDPRPYQTVVDQDRANVSTAKAQFEKDKASLAYAKLTFDRDTSLLKDGVVSQDTFDDAKSVYDQLQAQIGVDEATIAEHEAELNTAEVNLGYTDITSPVDGTVVSRNVTMGQTVAASFQTPTLFLIATDLTKMQVDTNVSESDMGNLREGDKASFTVEAFPNRTFEGMVVQVRQSPQTVQNVVTYDIVVAVDNRALALKPGMTATTRIITDERKDVLRLPDQAFRYVPRGLSGGSSQPSAANVSLPPGGSSKESSIWVLRDGHPHRIPVKLGLDDDSYTEIVSGELQVGDQVITSEQRRARRQNSGATPTMPKF
jgi:HlyD family secretion protein